MNKLIQQKHFFQVVGYRYQYQYQIINIQMTRHSKHDFILLVCK